MKKIFLFLIVLLSTPPILACTTIIVGKKASTDGSIMIARNDDFDASVAKQVIILPYKKNHQNTILKSHENNFTYSLPKISYKYLAVPNENPANTSYQEACLNQFGFALSATESFINNQKALSVDPYVVKTGINEESIPAVIMPQTKTARDGIQLLGSIVSTTGTAEGLGVAMADKDEAWYFETASGHRWAAVRIPDNSYFVAANQSRIQHINLKDKENYMGSSDLISFAIEHNLYNPKKEGVFDFRRAYSKISSNDITYNYYRLWIIQHRYNPHYNNDYKNGSFPVFLIPEHKLSLRDVKGALRDYYQNTPNDPYTLQNPNEPFRPITVFRSQESHIIKLRSDLPENIGNILYVAMGMQTLSAYLPFYQGLNKIPEIFHRGTSNIIDDSAFWRFRKLQTLTMINFPQYAPHIMSEFEKLESLIEINQQKMENHYLSIYKKHPKQANKLISLFTASMSHRAFALTQKLTDQLFAAETHATDMKYHFAGS